MMVNDTVMNQAEETNSRVQSHAMDIIQHFQLTSHPCQSNTQLTQAGQSQIVEMNPLLSTSTGWMHQQPNNSLMLPGEARMSSSQPYIYQLSGYPAPDNIDGLSLLNHHHTSQLLVNETCPIENEIVQSLLSQPNQIDGQMCFQLNQGQTSQDSGQTHGSQRTPAAIRSKRNRDKNKEMMETLKKEKEKAVENEKTLKIENEKAKAKENERVLTEENRRLTAENITSMNKIRKLKWKKITLMNTIRKLKSEKMEWEKEKKVPTANMTTNTESFEKLAAPYETLSQSISLQIPQPLATVVIEEMLEEKHVTKQCIEELEGFQHSNKQISTQNIQSYITKKIVLKLDIYDGKDTKKAMRIVAGLSGTKSVSMDMKHQKLTVTGDVDPVRVVCMLRSKYTDLLTIGMVKEEKKDGGAKKDEGDGEVGRW